MRLSILTDLLQSVKLVATWPRSIELRGEAVVLFKVPERITLHLVLAGSTRIRATDGAFERSLETGQYLFVPAGHDHLVGGASRQPHVLVEPRQDDRIPVVRIGDGQKACSLLSAEVECDQIRLDAVARIMPEVKRHIPQGAPTIFALPELLSTEGLRQNSLIAGGNALFQCAAEAMFVNAVRLQIASGSVALPESAHPPSASVAAAMRLMYRNPERDWTLRGLAAASGVSRSTFAAAFSQQLGTTPMAFLSRVRMMRAESLLKENRHALTAIAALCGYRSETAFNRAFSNHAGISPGAWRRTMRKTTRA